MSHAFSLWFLTVLLMGPSLVFSQEDTLQVQLFNDDDLDPTLFFNEDAVSSANRLIANPEDLAQEIIIIDGDDIRKFGYSTLVDVLKNIPGFRTSQPGNAIEGETFLMRGLYGNEHAKILINGIPIKPEAVKGMPIAAQLPIRHAEFIEIVLGPSSSSYGSEAMAGVINIVFPEIDRPVFAWADIGTMNPGVTEFNLTLGGKSGKGKNVLNYEFFASSQRAQDVNLLIPDDSIRVDVSELDSVRSQLFVANQSDLTLPEINELSRESRLIGAYIKFRWFELNATSMYRNEHSALGFHPLTSSYSSPELTFGENINSFSIKYRDEKKKRYTSSAAISSIFYRTHESSSYIAIDDPLAIGRNFTYARSFDLRAEYTGTFKLTDNMLLLVGTTGQFSLSHPFTTYLDRPFRPTSDGFTLTEAEATLSTTASNPSYYTLTELDTVILLETHERKRLAGFAQYLYTSDSKKLNIELGTRVDIEGDEVVFTPKVGVVYRPIKKLKLTGYFGQGYRAPNSYYTYNNYTQSLEEFALNNARLQRVKDTILASELLTGIEGRAEWKINDQWKLTGRYYAHWLQNRLIREVIIAPDSIQGPPPQEAIVGYRYFNGNARSFLGAGMITLNYNGTTGEIKWDALLSYEYARGWEFIELEDNVPETAEQLSDYRYVPRHSVKLNIKANLDKWTLSIFGSTYGNYISEIYRQNGSISYDYIRNYFTNVDVLLHYDIFRQMSVFVGTYNIFNTVQSGIPSSTLTSQWTFNPQYGRLFKFGLNFQLN